MHHKHLPDPVFLLCSERSGSNLIARIFGAHPDFFAPSPAHLFRVFSRLDQGAHMGDALLQLFDAKLGVWKLDARPAAERKRLISDCRTTGEMIATLLNAEGDMRGKPRLFLKENSAYGFLDFMEQVSDAPQYVLMVRDPRDMALSWISAATLRGGVVRAARRWLSDVEGALAAQTEKRPIVTLTYEALVSRPEETLCRVCDALSLPFSTDMLEHVRKSDGVAQDAGRTALWKNLTRDIMSDNFNKFKGRLSEDQIAFIEALCGPMMDHFGYERCADAAAPYGRHDTLKALEAALAAVEPWEKAAYQALSADERSRLEHWSSLRQELNERYGQDETRG